MLRIDRDIIIERFDDVWEELNTGKPRDLSGRPCNPILDVGVFMNLNAQQASFLAELHGADALYSVMEIAGGKFRLRPEYLHLAIKGAERRQARTAWVRWFKEKTAKPKAKKVRAPRKSKGGAA